LERVAKGRSRAGGMVFTVKSPGDPVMSYQAFFRNRRGSRYEGGGARCC